MVTGKLHPYACADLANGRRFFVLPDPARGLCPFHGRLCSAGPVATVNTVLGRIASAHIDPIRCQPARVTNQTRGCPGALWEAPQAVCWPLGRNQILRRRFGCARAGQARVRRPPLDTRSHNARMRTGELSHGACWAHVRCPRGEREPGAYVTWRPVHPLGARET